MVHLLDLQRLIPAHAGKTQIAPSLKGLNEAHPRSRGENPLMVDAPGCVAGSSPLTRGKLGRRGGGRGHRGLIPAHAGKTCRRPRSSPPGRAHPRSRGENRLTYFWNSQKVGSSPLTRGKLPHRERGEEGGLAHPRSRGENLRLYGLGALREGSSPLTRGKPGCAQRTPCDPGLIPAHAGKTRTRSARGRRNRAHPRSRGENRRAAFHRFER